jgi:polyisoprenoid-binding protein YceI
MMRTYWKKLSFTLLVLLPVIAIAATPVWKIVPSESSLTFTATQNDAPVTGQFKNFTGEINFDPNQLKGNNVKIIVDLGSITDPYNQLSDNLKTSDWFNTKLFPQAVFQSSDFVKTGDKTYQSKGTLAIRGKTVPVTLEFSQESYTPTKAVIKGSTTIKRTAFGVGQGQWSDTKTVKDDVQVNFTITAVTK